MLALVLAHPCTLLAQMGVDVTFLDYLYAVHMQTYSDCSFIFRS